jgi:hypothetical protein
MHTGSGDCNASFGQVIATINHVTLIKVLRCERPAGHPRASSTNGSHCRWTTR